MPPRQLTAIWSRARRHFFARSRVALCFVWLVVGAPDLDRHYQFGGDHAYQLVLGQQNAIPQYLPDIWGYVENEYPTVALATTNYVVRGAAHFQARAARGKRLD